MYILGWIIIKYHWRTVRRKELNTYSQLFCNSLYGSASNTKYIFNTWEFQLKTSSYFTAKFTDAFILLVKGPFKRVFSQYLIRLALSFVSRDVNQTDSWCAITCWVQFCGKCTPHSIAETVWWTSWFKDFIQIFFFFNINIRDIWIC